eukprot:Sdes_comp21589_c0_seq1m20192
MVETENSFESSEKKLWTSFQNAASSVTQLYRECELQKKKAFSEGQTDSMRKLLMWLKEQQNHQNEPQSECSIKIDTLLRVIQTYMNQCEESSNADIHSHSSALHGCKEAEICEESSFTNSPSLMMSSYSSLSSSNGSHASSNCHEMFSPSKNSNL